MGGEIEIPLSCTYIVEGKNIRQHESCWTKFKFLHVPNCMVRMYRNQTLCVWSSPQDRYVYG